MQNKDGVQVSSENSRTIGIQEIEGAKVESSDKLFERKRYICHPSHWIWQITMSCLFASDSLLGKKDSIVVVITSLTTITKDLVLILF